jgi:uncharacterized NAD(P)/FAD-binding protein YdhS
MKLCTVAIVGGGCSGTLAAINLARLARTRDIRVVLIERSADVGLGLAYKVPSDRCKLNVPVSGMSAFPDDPDNFLLWAAKRDPDITPDQFVSRRLYGLYLQELLAAHSSPSSRCIIEIVKAEAIDIKWSDTLHSLSINLSTGETVHADYGIVAIGNTPRRTFGNARIGEELLSPYATETYQKIKSSRSILVIGTSLTAVDCILEAEGVGYAGSYTMLSRHGRLPLPHETSSAFHSPSNLSLEDLCKLSLRECTRVVVREARSQGSSQSILHTIRPILQKLWSSFSLSDQKRFMRHIRPIWEPHRHRIPRPHYALLQALISSGRLQVKAGRIRLLKRTPDGVSAEIHTADRIIQQTYNSAILCAGPEGDPSASEEPLLKNLLTSQVLTPGALRLGCTISKNHKVSSRIRLLGPPQRETLWEITAVREIRTEAQKVAQELVAQMT